MQIVTIWLVLTSGLSDIENNLLKLGLGLSGNEKGSLQIVNNHYNF